MKKIISMSIFLALGALAIAGYLRSESFLKEAESLMASQLAEIVGMEVEVGNVSWRVFPLPYIAYKNVKTRDGGVEELRIHLSPTALTSGKIRLSSLKATKGRINTRLLSHLINLDKGNGDGLKITASEIALVSENGKHFGNFSVDIPADGTITIKRNGDQQIALTLKPRKGKYRAFSIKGKRWCLNLPRKPLCLDNLTANGKQADDDISVQHFSGQSLGGKLSGAVSLKQLSKWRLNSSVNIDQVNAQQLLQLVSSSGVSGRLNGQAVISGHMEELGSPLKGISISGPFDLHSGAIDKANLKRAANFKSSEGITPFSKVSGKLHYQGHSVKLNNLRLTSSALAANGRLNIYKRRLSGELDVGIKGTTGLLSVPMDVTGTTESPKVAPKPEVIAAAAAGTALLGPAGALLGTKVGSILSKGVSQFKNKDASGDKQSTAKKGSPSFID